MNKNANIVILGGGPCGLSAAWALTKAGFKKVTLLEKNQSVGGIVRSEAIEGNAYDYGAHYFHSDDEEIAEKILALIKGGYTVNKRNLMIKFNGSYFQYPLQVNDLIKGFSVNELFFLFSSMCYSLLKNKIRPRSFLSAEDVLIAKYGQRLYEKFFEGYIVNFWSMHPSQLSAKFAQQRISRLDALEILKKMLSIFHLAKAKSKQDEFIEAVKGSLYYPHSGMSEIWEEMAKEIALGGGEIITEAKINAIKSDGKNKVKQVFFEHKGKQASLQCDFLVNTIPLASFMGYFDHASKQSLQAALDLKYRSLIIICLLVAKENILPSYCTYFHNRVFGRISEPKLAGLRVNPRNHTILLVEKSCDYADRDWSDQNELIEKVYSELEEEKLLSRNEIKRTHVLKERFAYPVFDLKHEANIKHIREFLSSYENIFSTGRQGLFQYVNAHKAVGMGFLVAENIINAKFKGQAKSSPFYF